MTQPALPGEHEDAARTGSAAEAPDRRTVLSTLAMLLGLAGGYGMFTALAARFLYPARSGETRWQFVAALHQLAAGSSLGYRAPTGQQIVITRLSENGTADDFVALSSVCPHLGCQVHWEPHNDRFFCPCHNGAFDSQGKATEGPPQKAGQSLSRYPLKVESGLLFIEIPVGGLS